MKKDKKINTISPEYRECFALMASRPEYSKFVKFMNIQKSNLAIVEWFRIKSTDPVEEIKRKKAYFEGQYDFIVKLLEIFESSKNKKEDKDE